MKTQGTFGIPAITCLVFFLFSFGKMEAQQEDYSLGAMPPSLLKDASAIIRKRDIVFEINSPTEMVLKEHRVVTLLGSNTGFDKLVLGYDGNSRIRKLSGNIYDLAGQLVRKVQKDEIHDQSAISSYSIYEDNRIKYVDLALSRYPVTVEFTYEKNIWDKTFIPDWDIQPFNTAVQSASYTLIAPVDFKVDWKLFNIDLEVEQTNRDGEVVRKWEVSNLPAIRQEPYAPPPLVVLPHLVFAPHSFSYHGYNGSWESWEAFGAFMSELMNGTRELPEDLKQEVHGLLEGLATTEEKINVLYRYLQQNTRYVSVQIEESGWQPYPAKDVAGKKYGDCKGLSNYMKALLDEAGIEAWPALIYRSAAPNVIPEDFVMPSFNHMILYLPSENKWLECTEKTYPPGYTGWSNQNRKALLITGEAGRLVHTPELEPAENFARHHTRLFLSKDGKARFTDVVQLGGAQHEWLRYAVVNLSAAELKEKYLMSTSLPAANLSKFHVEVADDKPQATVTLEGEFLKYAAKSGKRLFVPVNVVDAMTTVPEEMEKRSLPVWSHTSYSDADSITIVLPEGYKVESSPSPIEVQTAYGNYHLDVKTETGKMIIVRKLEVLPVRIPAEEYQQWRAFFKEVAKADASMVVLVEQKT